MGSVIKKKIPMSAASMTVDDESLFYALSQILTGKMFEALIG